MNQRRPWRAHDIATLSQNYSAMGAEWCATKLRRSLSSVHNKAYKLGLAEKIVTEKSVGKDLLGPATVHNARLCHDCKRPTVDYRCPACWEKRRAKYRGSCDGPTADEMYGVMT